MSQASNSDNESRLSSIPFSIDDPGDGGSVWKPTKAAKALVLPLVQRPRREAQKGKGSQARLPISKVIFYLNQFLINS